jgi:PAS domain S-box-containing protein
MIKNPKTSEELIKELTDLKLENESMKTRYEQYITKSKRAEETLRENEERYRLLYEVNSDGIMIADVETMTFKFANPALCRMFGYTEEELKAMSLENIHPENDLQWIIAEFESQARGEKTLATEIPCLRKDGKIFYADINASNITIDGRPHSVGLFRNVTDRKQAELIIEKQNEQLRELNATKDKFFSIIAHDLKSPFQGFLGLTQEIIQNASNISVKDLTKIGGAMYQSADNLFKLLHNLLEWAMMQSGSASIVLKDILLSDMIAQNVEAIKVRSELKGISINNIVKDQIHAYADERMVNSVLLNLLSNAVKFTKQKGTITISAKEIEDQMIEVSIRDTGIGMPKSIMDKLFILGEKTGRKGTDGELSTGLGLMLCREFIDKNGGKIWVNSEEGKGSTFYFTLPSLE